MKFYFYNFDNWSLVKKYTYAVLRHAAKKKGHEIVENPSEADFVCVNFTDTSEVDGLNKARKVFGYDKLLIGGHSAKFIKLANIFGKHVWVGHCFELFDCESKDEVVEHRSCYVEGKNKVVWSDKVEWDLVPYVLMGDKLLLWAEKGCNRLCRYCSTSWTDKHERNTEENFERAKIYCEKNKKLLHLVQNEFSEDITERVGFLSITVRKYLQNWGLIRSGATVRIGIEFINEDVRRKYIPSKFFTDEELMELFYRAMSAKHNLRLFCITGVEPAEDWHNFFEELPELDFKTSVLFKFTPITHVMFTPFFKKRFEVDFNNYIDRERHAGWYMRNLNRAWWRTVIGGVFEGVYRTAIQLCENIEELRWLNKIKMSEMSEEKKVNEVIDSDIYKRDYQRMVEFEWWTDEMKKMVYD